MPEFNADVHSWILNPEKHLPGYYGIRNSHEFYNSKYPITFSNMVVRQ